jgi:hypothetical protein
MPRIGGKEGIPSQFLALQSALKKNDVRPVGKSGENVAHVRRRAEIQNQRLHFESEPRPDSSDCQRLPTVRSTADNEKALSKVVQVKLAAGIMENEKFRRVRIVDQERITAHGMPVAP